MGERIRAHGWARTPLGPVETWPTVLRTTVSVVLGARSAMGIYWGSELVLLYNDAWRELIGSKHPDALGRPAREVFPEIWETVGPMLHRVLSGAGAVEVRDQPSMLKRREGGVEEVCFDFTLNPISSDDGSVGGVLALAFETTEQKRAEEAVQEGEERQAFLLRLSDQLRPLADPLEIQTTAARVLGEHLEASRVHYAEVSKGGEYAVVKAAYASDAPSVVGRHRLDDYGPVVFDDARAGRAVAVDDVQNDPRLTRAQRRQTAALAALDAYLVVPLHKQGRTVALLVVHHARPHRWTEREISLVQETAERTWAAVERARAEAALREGEERYRALFESMDEAYAVVEVVADDDGRWSDFLFLEVNPAFMEHTGMPYPVGQRATQLLGTPNPRWAELYGRVAETGESLRLEESELTLGRTFDLNIFRLEGPGSRRVAVLFQDITERRRAELALRESEERFRRSVENLPLPFLICSAQRTADGRIPDFRVEYANLAASTGTGRSPEDYVGRTVLELYPQLDGSEIFGWCREVIETGEPVVRDAYLFDADPGEVGDTPRYFDLRIAPLGDGFTANWQDVTERVAREQELERRVEERTQEVQELARTLSVAEQQERQRLSRLLHDDLQQLLYGVQMKIALARKRAARDDVEGVLDQTDLSLGLLDDAIRRTRQLTVDLNPPILEGEGLVGAIDWLRTQMRDVHGVEVKIRAGEEIDVRPPDLRILLFQTTRELLFNVAKHAGTDRALVEVSQEEGRLTVSVTDEGSGFDPASISPGHSGLGLFSARERLRMRGGDLEIDSQPGHGARVVAYAPLAGA